MSEPSYGSGQSYEQQQGYGSGAGYGQQYGGQPYGTGQQPQQPAPPQQAPYGGYGQPGTSGYPAGGYPSAPSPATRRAPANRLALVATLLTIVGYVCAGAGVLGFILWLTVEGDATYRFAAALDTLVVGIGLGGLNYAVGSWLAHRDAGTSR